MRGQRRALSIRVGKTDRLVAEIKAELEGAAAQSRRTGKPARRFKDFRWMTRSS